MSLFNLASAIYWTHRNAWRTCGGDADENSWVWVNVGNGAKVHRPFVAVVNNPEKHTLVDFAFFIFLNLLPSLSTDGSWNVFICLQCEMSYGNSQSFFWISQIYLNWRMVRSTGNFSSASGLFTLTWNCKDIYRATDEKANYKTPPEIYVSQDQPQVQQFGSLAPQTWGRTRRTWRPWRCGCRWSSSSRPWSASQSDR